MGSDITLNERAQCSRIATSAIAPPRTLCGTFLLTERYARQHHKDQPNAVLVTRREAGKRWVLSLAFSCCLCVFVRDEYTNHATPRPSQDRSSLMTCGLQRGFWLRLRLWKRYESRMKLWVKRIGTGFGALAAFYLIAALIGSFWPVNRDWAAPLEGKGVTIHLVSNGYHTGLLLPASVDGLDLTLTFRPTDLPDPNQAGNFLLFGWGDRDFYLETQTWADVKPATAITALFGSGQSLVHVDHIRAVAELPGAKPIQLSRAQYRALVADIQGFLALGPDGYPIRQPGYGSLDVFYDAKGQYSHLMTCNVWTSDRLAAAGVRTGAWTPFSGGVMRWH
jgi:uncharacterized protein (TIGR02117 family)